MVWDETIFEDRARARLACDLVGYAYAEDPESLKNAPTRGRAQEALRRHMAIYLCHVGFSMSLGRLGAAFGRDRATISYAIRRIEDMRDDHQIDVVLDALERVMRAAPPPFAGIRDAECADKAPLRRASRA